MGTPPVLLEQITRSEGRIPSLLVLSRPLGEGQLHLRYLGHHTATPFWRFRRGGGICCSTARSMSCWWCLPARRVFIPAYIIVVLLFLCPSNCPTPAKLPGFASSMIFAPR